jgi:hypothetical protein
VGKDRYLKQIIETEVRCEVVNPLLDFSLSAVNFVYSWVKDVHASTQRQELTLTNTSSLSLSFLLKTELPFTLNTFDATLAPGQKLDIDIDFDPIYRDDSLSHIGTGHMIYECIRV